MLKRMIDACLLKASVYEEVEHDTNATLQAVLVVIVVSIAVVLGSYMLIRENIIFAVVMGIIFGFVHWAVIAFVTYIVGTKIFNTENTHANWSQMSRAIAFAQTPGLFMVFCFLPGIFLPGIVNSIGLIVFIWRLCTTTVAVRQVLDYDHLTRKVIFLQSSTWRALAVVILSYLIVIIPIVMITNIVGVSP